MRGKIQNSQNGSQETSSQPSSQETITSESSSGVSEELLVDDAASVSIFFYKITFVFSVFNKSIYNTVENKLDQYFYQTEYLL